MMRNTIRWAAIFVVALVAVMLLGMPEHALAAGTLAAHPGVLTGAMAVPALLGSFALVGRTAEGEMPTVTLVSKNRAANDLRGKAAALRAEILDTTKPLDKVQLDAKVAEIRDLEQRANVIAEFTPDAEIERQGGAGDLTRLDSPEQRGPRKEVPVTLSDSITDFTKRAKLVFGNVRNFMNVAVAGTQPIANDEQKRMVAEAKTLTRAIVGTTGDVSGGEYLLPLTQVASIFSLANVQQGLLQRARTYNVPGRSLRIPYLIQDDSAASTTLNRPMAGNIANVAIIGEGSTKDVRAPKFGQRLLTVFKYAAYTQVGDELLGDDFTGELPQEFINAVGQQALNKVNEDITIDGAGTTEPNGALYANAAWNIAQTRTTANTIKPDDIFGMYAKHTHGPNSVWLASRRTVQALYNMSLTSASLVTFLRDLNGPPQMMLLGYPVVLTDILPTLGSASDIALVNPDFYAFALRQALTVELSREFAFIQDLTTYRFVVRAGGIPINPGKYAYKYAGSNGVDEHSPFVYLAA